ncbi:S-layer homology domain-containing protein [Brachybacterium vulturis]|uniref:S-layer homology domain-containing protein n=1 Tax=Brachybacterium vulturis TaxID=2017484 RepID=UPI003734DD13
MSRPVRRAHGTAPVPTVMDATRSPGRRLGLVLLALLMVAAALTAAPSARAEDPPPGLGGFSANYLITETMMWNSGYLTRAEVDDVLEDRGARCVDGTDGAPCLKNLRADTPERPATDYCAAIPAVSDATAARIITDVALACDVNPAVLIVMLQKEQGLITTRDATQKQLDEALGFRCPDFEGCAEEYKGFTHQIYHAASRLQEYGDPDKHFTYQAGGTYDIQYSPYPFCGYGEVQIANRATAALYNYTPFTPTQATLDAGAAAVPDDVCATYGNRNFFRTFSLWFESPTGTPEDRSPQAAPWGKDPAAPFVDVPYGSSIFFTEIAWMEFTELSTGWPDGTYRPLQPINRDAMVAFLYRAAGEPEVDLPSRSPFTDVSPGSSIFYEEIVWAESVGITNGWPDGTFRPLEPVNRDAMAAFLYRADGAPAFTAPVTSPFTDVSERSSIFYEEITWAEDVGITTGWPDGTYRPLQPIKRDAMAAFVYRMTVD